jgi:hypothetical protein
VKSTPGKTPGALSIRSNEKSALKNKELTALMKLKNERGNRYCELKLIFKNTKWSFLKLKLRLLEYNYQLQILEIPRKVPESVGPALSEPAFFVCARQGALTSPDKGKG